MSTRVDIPSAPRPSGSARAGRLARNWIESSGPLRRIVKSAPVQDQIMTARALTVVRERGRFLRGQIAGRGTGRYELRDAPGVLHLRHGTGDVAILNKIFARDPATSSYQPPAPVAAALDAAPTPRILDVGANIGLFGVFARGRWPQARITAFEPDPDNFRVLDLTVRANQRQGDWDDVPAAVSNAVGELSFVPSHGAKSHLAPSSDDGQTIVVPAVDFFDQIGDGVDLVKMDIEGGEWEILADARLADAAVKVIRLEWHTLLCPEQDARAAAIDLLYRGGFPQVVDGDRQHARNGVLWAWREAL
jgi:FkbM family methyltransferase